jgi:hypothetical protein
MKHTTGLMPATDEKEEVESKTRGFENGTKTFFAPKSEVRICVAKTSTTATLCSEEKRGRGKTIPVLHVHYDSQVVQ